MLFNKFSKNITFFFFIFFAIFPIGLAILSATDYFQQYRFFKMEFIFSCLFFIWVISIIFRKEFSAPISQAKLIFIIFGSTFIIRGLGMIILNVQPVSDFENAFSSALNHLSGPINDLYGARFPYWGFYIVNLSFILKIFGPTLLVVKYLNLFLAGLTAVGIYLLGKKMSGSKKIGGVAAIIYAFWPADILYKNLPTGEHFFVMLLPFACLLFLTGLQSNMINKKSVLLIGLSGITLGLMDMYKPIAIVLIIAIVITALVLFFESFDEYKKNWPSFLLLIVLFTSSYLITKEACYSVVRHEMMNAPNQYGYGTTLRVGLDPDYDGKYNVEISTHIKNLTSSNNENYELVNKLLLQETSNIIKNRKFELGNLFIKKFYYMWSSESQFYTWTTADQEIDSLIAFTPKVLAFYVTPWADAYWLLTLIFSFIGVVYSAIKQKHPELLSIGLFIFGFALLLLVTEVQQRYRIVIVSSLPIFCAYGIYATREMVDAIKKTTRKLLEKMEN